MNPNSEMYYFGPLEDVGHFLFAEGGRHASREEYDWHPWGDDIDGAIQPGVVFERGSWRSKGALIDGEAVLHHKDGWTALSFWDRTIDSRPGSHSTYIARGIFTFEQMVEMAKSRFAGRWGEMKFEVRLSPNQPKESV